MTLTPQQAPGSKSCPQSRSGNCYYVNLKELLAKLKLFMSWNFKSVHGATVTLIWALSNFISVMCTVSLDDPWQRSIFSRSFTLSHPTQTWSQTCYEPRLKEGVPYNILIQLMHAIPSSQVGLVSSELVWRALFKLYSSFAEQGTGSHQSRWKGCVRVKIQVLEWTTQLGAYWCTGGSKATL